MKINKYRCDRCKAETTYDDANEEAGWQRIKVVMCLIGGATYSHIHDHEIDLCKKCATEFENLVDAYVSKQENTNASD